MTALGLKLPQLTRFLLAACTKTEDNHPPVTVQDETEVGLIHNRQRMSKVDNSRRSNILYKQLPSLQPGGSDLGSVVAMQNIAVSTEQFRVAFDRNTHQRRLDAEEKKKPTTIGERYPHHLDRILKLCNVEREEDLPIIWQQMANRKREGEPLVALLQTQVGVQSVHLGKTAMMVTVSH